MTIAFSGHCLLCAFAIEKVFAGNVAGGNDVCIMRIAREFQVDPANSPLGFKMTYPRLSNSSADFNTSSTTPGIYKAIGKLLKLSAVAQYCTVGRDLFYQIYIE